MNHKAPILLDTTLRDGEQSPGIYFTNEEKLEIASRLDELGVGIIEAGIPAMSSEERNVLARLADSKLHAKILSWNRLLKDDVLNSLNAGLRSIHVSIPTSDILLDFKLKKERNWVFQQIESVISFAVSEGAEISLGAEDSSRTETAFLKEVFLAAANAGAIRVRYADTLGILTPDKTAAEIALLVKDLPVPLDFHGHNDFGMATANAVAAWEAGAGVISCSLLGLGERAGNTPLEEFAGALHFLKGQYKDFDFVKLRKLCEYISEISGRKMFTHKPLFGSDIFRHESGIHVDGILKDASTYELFPPEKVGGRRELVPGKHSGRAAIRHLAARNSVELNDSEIQDFLTKMRSRMAIEKGVDPDKIFQEFLSERRKL